MAKKLGKLDPHTGIIIEYPFSGIGELRDIDIDSANNIWFTTHSTNILGKCSPQGIITTYLLPAGVDSLNRVAVDLNDKIWATAFYANKIIRFDPVNETFTLVKDIPTANAGASGLEVDSYNVIWLVERYGGKVARCTQNGQITEYSIPTFPCDPGYIALDQSNNIWFTEASANKIGYMLFPDYTLGAEGSSLLTISPGGVGLYTFNLSSLNGFNFPINLTVTGLPSGVTGFFSSNSIIPPGQTSLTIEASSETTVGTYPLTVTGDEGSGVTHTVTVTLNIQKRSEITELPYTGR